MSKKAIEFLLADLPEETEAEQPSARRRAIDFLRAEPAAPKSEAPKSAARSDAGEPWWKQRFGAEGESGMLTSGRDIARVPIAIADAALSSASHIIGKPAASAAGAWAAINPNDTYLEARDRLLAEYPIREPATGSGRQALEGLGKVMSLTGIPQTAEFAGRVVKAVAGEEAADFLGSALELATLGRARAVSPHLAPGTPMRTITGPSGEMIREAMSPPPAAPPMRTIYGESGEVLGREPVQSIESLRLGGDAGAASAAVDLSRVSPDLRAELQAKLQAGNLNPEVAQAQIAAETLGLPPLTRGQASGNPAHISHEHNLRGTDDRLRERFTAQNEAMVEKIDDIRRETTPNVVGSDVIQNGQTLVDSYKAYDANVTADIAAKYTALREAMKETGATIDHQGFISMAENALRESGKTHWLPAEVRSLMNDAKAGMTFRDFETMRTVLASAARTAERQGNGNAAGAISAVRGALEELPLTGPAAETLKPLADAARTAARERFRSLELDPAYRAAVGDDVPLGEASALADKFIDQYVIRGRAANIARMRETLAADPTASETITAGTLNYLKQRAVPSTGNFAAARYNETLRQLEPRMRELLPPETAEQLQALGAYARAATVQPRGSFVNTSNTATSLLAEGARSAVDAAAAMHGLPTPSMISNLAERAGIKKTPQTRYVDEALKPGAGLDEPRLNQLLKPPRR